MLTVFLLFLVILLAFPFIKSFLVSAEETLDTGDILMALLSLFLLCYIYVFMHMNVYSVASEEKEKREMLQVTGDSIKGSFLSELNAMQRQLQHYDRVFSARDSSGKKIQRRPFDSSWCKPVFYADFNRVYWLDTNGIQVGEFVKGRTAFSDSAAYHERDYHDRDYFKAVKNKALWYPEYPDADKIYLEPIYSRVDGSFRAVMSKKSDSSLLITAMGGNMKSVINTVQPGEINFCLLDDKGNILFTSAGSEHINENLPEECDYAKELSAAMYSRASAYFDRPFMGNDCSFYISPVNGLPLYLVTFTNNGMTGDMHLQICIFTSLFILAILIMFSSVILILILLKSGTENKIVKKPFIDLSILYPSSNYLYRDFGGIFFNFVLTAALVVSGYICRDEPFTLIVMLLINAGGTTAAFCYSRVDLKPLRRAYFWAVTGVFFVLCDVFLWHVGANENIPAFISLICYELLIIWVIIQLRTIRYHEKDFAAFAAASGNAVYKDISASNRRGFLQNLIINMQEKLGKLFNTRVHYQFSAMLMTWFLLIALLPSVFVYRYFYKNENENRIKALQIDIARQWFDKSAYKKDGNPNPDQPVDNSAIKSYLAGFYRTQLISDSAATGHLATEETAFNEQLNHFRFSIIPKDDRLNAVLTGKTDNTILFRKDSGRLSMAYRNLLNHPGSQGRNNLIVQTRLPGFPMPGIGNILSFVFYFVAPLFFLLVLYLVIRFFLQRFFLFEILPLKRKDETALFDRLLYRYNTEAFRLIVLGVTASGKKDLVKRAVTYIYNEQNKQVPEGEEKHKERLLFMSAHVFMYDLSEIDIAVSSFNVRQPQKGDIIVLSHFEHELSEKTANDKKYQLISRIFQMNESSPNLIILSNIHPSVFLNNLKDKTDTASFKAEDYINKQDYYNWTGILSGFEIYIKPYREGQGTAMPVTEPDILATYDAYRSKYTFYLSIWNSLERIEKFVLYDLAKDNLVNYRNKEALYSLYCKGLVVQNDMPALVNEELSVFILNELNEEDVKLEKEQSGSSSAWSTFKIPFLMILLTVLLFVFITQQETFNKLMAGLVAVAGSLPLLIKLMSSSQEKKPG